MKFWDTSGIVPLLVIEPVTPPVKEILRGDESVAVWWGTRIECVSALVRRVWEGTLDDKAEDQARNVLRRLAGLWTEVHPIIGTEGNGQENIGRVLKKTAPHLLCPQHSGGQAGFLLHPHIPLVTIVADEGGPDSFSKWIETKSDRFYNAAAL